MQTELVPNLLKRILTEESLNNLIQTTTSLEELNCLLRVKSERIQTHDCEKLHFNINCIYKSDVDFNIGTEILEKTLLVASNPDFHLVTTKQFCLNELQSSNSPDELLYIFELLNVVLKYCKNEHRELSLTIDETNQLNTGILTVIKESLKPLTTFTLVCFLPNLLHVNSRVNNDKLLNTVFNFIKETKKLEILCISFDKFVSSDSFDLMNDDSFWFLLNECLVSQQLQKPASYLLSKSVELMKKTPNLAPNYLKSADFEQSWQSYFTLLDVSNEKLLHIIEPSLPLFNSIRSLHIQWRLCLYKIFLNHSQNVVVYYVASFILDTEKWTALSKLLPDFLLAINKNEYNSDCNRIFQKIGNSCTGLNEQEFIYLVEESLKVPWIPAAIWGFFSNTFQPNTTFRLSLSLLENILSKLKQIPHKFIRDGCTKLVLKYFLPSYAPGTLNAVLKVSVILYNFDRSLFFRFAKADKIARFSEELCQQFVDVDNLQHVQIYLELMNLLKIDILSVAGALPYSSKTDLIRVFLLNQNHNLGDLEQYIFERIDSLGPSEDVSTLLILNQQFHTAAVVDRALDIVLGEDSNGAQKLVAYNILNEHRNEELGLITEPLKNTFNAADVRMSQVSVKLLCKYLPSSCIPERVTFLEHVLDSQSDATLTILEHITPFLTHIDEETVFQFIERCFNEFLILTKRGYSKKLTDSFLSQIFVPDLLENERFCSKLLIFSRQLLSFANNSNSVAYILSARIAGLIERDPQKGAFFIPIIIDLILNGILVNKNEKVEYCVCQEIGLFQNENCPNFEEMSARLLAFDSMLTLVALNKRVEVVDEFVSLLLDKYMKHFAKRYFPDSQIHIQKLRILQALLLLHNHIKSQKSKLIDFIIQSFLEESHQPSVKHLMQWLLVSLAREDTTAIHYINDKLQRIANNRPSTVSGLIPVVYHLVSYQDRSKWDQLVDVLLPYTMGAQFKLRIFSQVALVKLYRKSVSLQHSNFVEKYKFLNGSLEQVVEATGNAPYDIPAIHNEFLDYFRLDDYNCSTVFYTIPKFNGVTRTEWENLYKTVNLKHIRFNHTVADNNATSEVVSESQKRHHVNIQKKVTPWKGILDNMGSSQCTNDFILITSLIEKPANIGGLSRTCEVFGIKRMVMRTSKITSDKEFQSLSMSSENWVDILEVKREDLQTFVVDIKKQGYSVIGAEQTSDSVKLDEFQFPKMVALLLGNEKEGIPPNLIPLLDTCVEIPQFGMVRSLNVHVAGAIFMWEYCKQRKL